MMQSRKDSSSYSSPAPGRGCNPVFHGALIHTVQDQKHTLRAVESQDATETEALLSAAEQGQAGTGKFFYFSTFVQAALIVHELHLLDVASLRQVGTGKFFFFFFSNFVWAVPYSARAAAAEALLLFFFCASSSSTLEAGPLSA